MHKGADGLTHQSRAAAEIERAAEAQFTAGRGADLSQGREDVLRAAILEHLRQMTVEAVGVIIEERRHIAWRHGPLELSCAEAREIEIRAQRACEIQPCRLLIGAPRSRPLPQASQRIGIELPGWRPERRVAHDPFQDLTRFWRFACRERSARPAIAPIDPDLAR